MRCSSVGWAGRHAAPARDSRPAPLRRAPSALHASSRRIPSTSSGSGDPGGAICGADCGQSRPSPSPAHRRRAGAPASGPARCDGRRPCRSAPKAAPPECRHPDTSASAAPRRHDPDPRAVSVPRGKAVQHPADLARQQAHRRARDSDLIQRAAESRGNRGSCRWPATRWLAGDVGVPMGRDRPQWRAAGPTSRPARAGNRAPDTSSNGRVGAPWETKTGRKHAGAGCRGGN